MNVCVVTGTRAEYGLLYWLMKGINEERGLKLQVVVTGMHLSPEFGLTVNEIENQFTIDSKIEMLLSSDTPVGISKSIGLGTISFSETFQRLAPDLIVVLGDRFEIFSAVTAAMIARIPIAHISGGEATEGSIDEPIRHSITKMSHLHFTATEIYKKRVIQLGEQPDRVFNVGGLGIDNIKKLKLLSKLEFEDSISFKLNRTTFLVTFHPTTLEKASAKVQFQQLLDSFSSLPDVTIIFTKSNSDTDGRVINQMIDSYVSENITNCVAFSSLGQLRYLSALDIVDCVVGNSSSGLAEAPSFKVPTINIGDRQRGRIMADSVINCDPYIESISAAIKLALSDDFQNNLKLVKNPYGEGGASDKILNIIKNYNLENIIKKTFYDL
jgi:GDP/UDP-N,N'-diacetylbacillosamine 2-epimerase (hydrolysing)